MSSNTEGLLKLTIAQRGLWMGQKLAPAGSTFNIAEAIELPGEINEIFFRQALDRVGHEAQTLRARIVETRQGPMQEILPRLRGEVPVLDFSAEADPDAQAQAYMHARVRAPVDTASDPLWNNALIRLGPARYVWFHCCHHVALDGFSGGMVAARVAAIYSDLVAGREPEPSPFLPVATLLEQETAYRGSTRHEADRAYWGEYLANPPEPLSLSLRAQRPISGENGGVISRSVTLGDAVAERLTAMGKLGDATLPQTLTAMLVAYILRISGVSDLIIGMPVSARANRVLRQTPGMVANAVSLRFRADEATTFADLLTQSRRAMRGALRHQQYRYEELRRDLGFVDSDRQVSRIGINIEPFDYKLSFGDIVARNRNLCNGAMEDLTIFVFDRKDGCGLVLQFDANPARYTAAELDAHLARIVHLAADLPARLDDPVAELPVIRAHDTARWARQDAEVARAWPCCDIVTLFNDAARRWPSADAVLDRLGAATYAEFADGVIALAEAMRQIGVRPGHLVAIMLPRDRRMVQAMLAIASVGAAWLPIDFDGPEPRALAILEDAKPALVIAPERRSLTWTLDLPCLFIQQASNVMLRFSILGSISRKPGTIPPGTAYVTYTSGTTGKPKGVVVPHGGLGNLLLSMGEVLESDEHTRILAVTTITFDIAVLELLLPVVSGGSVVIAARDDVHDPRRMAALIRENAVTMLQATPTLWQTILGAGEAEALRGLTLLTGGEALPAHVATRLFQVGRAVFNVYGPTETTIWSTVHRLRAEDLETAPIGRPIANTQLIIADARGRPVPDGVVGELLIAGAGVASFYLDRPELTNARFVRESAEGRRAYRTGDRAARDGSGLLWLFGRADDQVKIRGMRIELAEVESAIAAMPGVREVAALVDKDRASGNSVLAAFIVPEEDDFAFNVAALRGALLREVPGQMVPTLMTVVDALPRNSSGKLDRAALLARPAQPVMAVASAPRTSAERMLAEIWCEILQVATVDIHANFFDLGGDSLMALQMVSALSERGHDIPVGQLFSAPTIANLAPFFEGRAQAVDLLAPLLPIRTSGNAPPIFCIHTVIGLGLGFYALASLLPPEHPVYALQNARLQAGGAEGASIEAMAAVYIALIREVQPRGPYHFVGWSMGGVIAHAIAARLREEGESIGMLAMLDSYPFVDSGVSGIGHADAARAAFDFLHLSLDDDQPIPATLDGIADILIAQLDHRLLERSVDSGGRTLRDLTGDLRAVTLRNIDMLQRHRAVRTDVDILFVRAALRGGEGPDGFICDDAAVWRDYATGEITVCDIACRHQDMLQPEHLPQVAELIAARLAQAPHARAALRHGGPHPRGDVAGDRIEAAE